MSSTDQNDEGGAPSPGEAPGTTETITPAAREAPYEPKPPVPDIGAAASDIVQLVKPRSDWWDEGALSSPIRGVAETDQEDPLDKFILGLPIPAYALLGLSGVVAIAFVGCIFQLFYDVPAAPVLGVPLTALIFALSGPTWVFGFIAAIKKGQAEADEEDRMGY